jgi:Domain of unknown function (DUF5916)/Carbohydrate family 9 binding domain-like
MMRTIQGREYDRRAFGTRSCSPTLGASPDHMHLAPLAGRPRSLRGQPAGAVTLAALVLSAATARADEKTAAVTSSTETPADQTVVDGVVPQRGMRPPPRIAAASRRQGDVAIDGRLDEQAWRSASPQNGFWQREPHEGARSRFATEFRVLYDEHAVYVGVRAFDPEPSLIRGLLTRRDLESSSDWISIKIDSYHDRRTAFGFSVNPAGVQLDILHFNDIEFDLSWDAVWESGVHTDGEGWTAELRIPYGQLRFPDAPEQNWGLQVTRRIHRTQELSVWSPWPKETLQEVSLFGSLTGIRDVAPARRLELLPYALGGARLYTPEDADPVLDGRDGVTGLGLDLKYGLGPSFTLTGTINPDFGQVEADPSQVNLGPGEIYFEEKRPFFLEGTDIFRFSLAFGDGDGAVEKLFYSRRIGGTPHVDPYDDWDYVDAPTATTIYGAAKLSGKTAGGWSFGLLDALTGQEDAIVALEGGEMDAERIIIEPLTNYAVGRVRKDLRQGSTTIGAAVTAVNRSVEGTKVKLHDQAYTVGLEGVHRFWDERWSADLRLAGSYVHGSPEAIDETQTSSVHYYQRPDADHIDYDPTRTSLTGTSMLWGFGKIAGGHWRGQVGGDYRSPGFEVNDLGFQKNGDYYWQWLWGQYRDDQPGSVIRQYFLNLNGWRSWNTVPEVMSTGGNVNGTVNFVNYWGVNGGIGMEYARRDPWGLRGGPMLRRDPFFNVWLNANSDTRRQVGVTVSANGFRAPASDSVGGTVSPLVTVQARGNLELAAGPTFGYNVDDNQYVDEVEDLAGDPHYVMGRIRQATAALTLRASYTFSPRMGLQLYAQPFVSTGRYAEYKEAVDPQARHYEDRYYIYAPDEMMDVGEDRLIDRNGDGVADYQFERADFNFRELRSNLVFRWEYRPGSTFFLIWSHGRTSDADDPDGRFGLGNDLSALADEGGEHLVLAKLNYWLGL